MLKLPAGAPAPARASEPAPATHVVPRRGPEPTPARLSAGDVQAVASQYGVSPSLAAAIAWQESGFNNSMVSDANARGVMQVMPGTWDYVQANLAPRALDPNSATDNVHAGVLYLKRLLDETGGDENAAIAGYYQGLASVQRAACTTTRSSTSPTCRRCARASAAERSRGGRAPRPPRDAATRRRHAAPAGPGPPVQRPSTEHTKFAAPACVRPYAPRP